MKTPKIVIILPIFLSFLFISCNKNKEIPAVTQFYNYLYFMKHDTVKEIWRFNALGRIDKEVYDTLNDSVLITYVYDSYNKLNQKKYYFLNSTGFAYRSVDTVADEKIICSYTYLYNQEGYVTRLDYSGAQYSDEFKTIATYIQGYTIYEIQQGNTTKITMHKVFSGLQSFTKDVVYENIFNEKNNVDGIQHGWEKHLGVKNANLLHKVIYTFKENNAVKESGVFNYTYTLDTTTNRIAEQIELYLSNNDSKVPYKTIINYEYK